MKLAMILVVAALTAGCSQQYLAKNGGGTATIDLPAGQKLVTATWKETSLWYLTRAAKPGEKPEALVFKESSSLGVIEGTVIFQEH